MRQGIDRCHECWLEANRIELAAAVAAGGPHAIPTRGAVEARYLILVGVAVSTHAHSDHYRQPPRGCGMGEGQ